MNTSEMIEFASSGNFAGDPEARRAKWADPDRTRISLSDSDYRKKHMGGMKDHKHIPNILHVCIICGKKKVK